MMTFSRAHGSNRSSDIRKITFNVTSNRKDSNESNQHTLVFAALQEPIYIVEWADIGKNALFNQSNTEIHVCSRI